MNIKNNFTLINKTQGKLCNAENLQLINIWKQGLTENKGQFTKWKFKQWIKHTIVGK